MKQTVYALVLALTFTTNIVPLTVNSTLLENKDTGKRVLLLGDFHDNNIEHTLHLLRCDDTKKLAQATLLAFDTVKSKQKKVLTKFAHAMLTDNNKQSAQTIVISEIGVAKLRSFCEEEVPNSLETMYVLPQVFVNHTINSASTKKDKQTVFEESMHSFGIDAKTSFQAKNGTRLIASDYYRNNDQDRLVQLMRTSDDLPLFKKTLPDYVAQINIGELKEDLLSWRNLYARFDLSQVDTEKLLTFIDEGIKAGNIAESTTLIDAAIQLRGSNPAQERALSDLLVQATAKKCDLELYWHIKAFEKDASLKWLILNAGIAHTDFIKTRVMKDGYTMVENSGSEALSTREFKEVSPGQTLNIHSKTLNDLEKQSPLVLLPKLFQA